MNVRELYQMARPPEADVEAMHLVGYRGGAFWVRSRSKREAGREVALWQVSWNGGTVQAPIRFVEVRRRAWAAFKAVQRKIDALKTDARGYAVAPARKPEARP